MNKVERNNVVIEDYTDMLYFDDIVSYFDKHYQEVLNFFGVTDLKSKWTIQFLPYKDFRNYMIEKKGICREFVRGNTSIKEKKIIALNVEDARNYTNHKDTDLMQICKMIIHELTHACYSEVVSDPILWFNEGLAQYLANQPKTINDVSDADFTIMLDNFYEFSKKSYPYSYYVVRYLFENYPLDEIRRLTFDKDYLISRTNDLFEETKRWAKEQSDKRKK